MNCSPTLGELAKALSKAQSVMGSAIKSNENPYFKSRYADLAAVWEACREPLTANGLSVVQIPCDVDGRVGVETILLHSSGEWISGMLLLKPVKDDPQAAGSAITYARRYGLQAAAGVATEDDDGNAASQPDKKRVAVTDREIRLGSPTLSGTDGTKGPSVKTAAPVGGQIAHSGLGNAVREAEGSGGDNARPSSAPAAQPLHLPGIVTTGESSFTIEKPFYNKLQDDVKAKQEKKPVDPNFVEFEGCVTVAQRKAFARAWKSEFPPDTPSKDVELLRHDWLKQRGFCDPLSGDPTSAIIPAALFNDYLAKARHFARTLNQKLPSDNIGYGEPPF